MRTRLILAVVLFNILVASSQVALAQSPARTLVGLPDTPALRVLKHAEIERLLQRPVGGINYHGKPYLMWYGPNGNVTGKAISALPDKTDQDVVVAGGLWSYQADGVCFNMSAPFEPGLHCWHLATDGSRYWYSNQDGTRISLELYVGHVPYKGGYWEWPKTP